MIVGCTQNEPLYDYDIEKKINEMGLKVPEPSTPIANYVPAVSFQSQEKRNWFMFLERDQKLKDIHNREG